MKRESDGEGSVVESRLRPGCWGGGRENRAKAQTRGARDDGLSASVGRSATGPRQRARAHARVGGW